jgi:hypothetical protein
LRENEVGTSNLMIVDRIHEVEQSAL